MWSPLRELYVGSFEAALATNRANILSFVQSHGGVQRARLLDLGCDDGSWTVQLAQAAGSSEVHGVELVTETARAASERGVQVCEADLNHALPYESGFFDLVHSNQVIEHVADIDLFVSEIRRVLKPGGVAVVSTENGSSWHNIFAAVLGWQMFSLTNVSGRVAGLGNPLAVHRNASAFSPTWRHRTIMNYRGLIELFQVHEFEDVQIAGAGYYPLPAVAGRLDVRHSAFLTIKASAPVAE